MPQQEPEEPIFKVTDRRASKQPPIIPAEPINPIQQKSTNSQKVTPPAKQAFNGELTLPREITNLFPTGFSLNLLRGTPQVLSTRVDDTLAGQMKVHKATWLPAPGQQGFEFGFDTTLAFDRFANYPCILIAFRDSRSGGFIPVGVYNCENHSIQIETNPIRLTPLTRDPVPALKTKRWSAFCSLLFPTSGIDGFTTFAIIFILLPYTIFHFYFLYQMLIVQKQPINIDAVFALSFGLFLVWCWGKFSIQAKNAWKRSGTGARPMTGDEAVKFVFMLGNLLQRDGSLAMLAQHHISQQAQGQQPGGSGRI